MGLRSTVVIKGSKTFPAIFHLAGAPWSKVVRVGTVGQSLQVTLLVHCCARCSEDIFLSRYWMCLWFYIGLLRMARRIFQFKLWLCQQTPKDPPLETDSFSIFHPWEASASHALGVCSEMLTGTSQTKMLEVSGAVDSMHQVSRKLKSEESWTPHGKSRLRNVQCPGPCRYLCQEVLKPWPLWATWISTFIKGV